MQVEILHLLDGAKKAKGLTVIIDVFRAFSVQCYLFANGVEKTIPVGDIDIAYELKKTNAKFILMGERAGQIQPGFKYGNSPTQIEHISFEGKTIIHTTSSGTQGIANAINADEIITGSFLNAQAIIDYINKINPAHVSLVAMGSGGKNKNSEDCEFAKYIKNALEKKENNFDEIKDRIKNSKSAKKFFDSDVLWAPERDFELCLQLDKFNFVLKSHPYKDDLVYLKKV